MQKDMRNTTHVSLTYNCWTSAANGSYISITAHYINQNWELKRKQISRNGTAAKFARSNTGIMSGRGITAK